MGNGYSLYDCRMSEGITLADIEINGGTIGHQRAIRTTSRGLTSRARPSSDRGVVEPFYSDTPVRDLIHGGLVQAAGALHETTFLTGDFSLRTDPVLVGDDGRF